MIQINKYGEKSVQIIKDGNTRTYNAVFRVRCDQNNIILSSGESNFYATDLQILFSDLQINGVAPTSALDAYDKLLIFVGLGFKSGGGTPGTTPTLQQVTDIGAVTTANITTGQAIHSKMAGIQTQSNFIGLTQLDVEAGRLFFNNAGAAVLSGGADAGYTGAIYIRPKGFADSTQQIVIPRTGDPTFNAKKLWHEGNLPYKEGVWPPAPLTTGIEFTVEKAEYIIIGGTVKVYCILIITADGTTASEFTVKGLPITSTSLAKIGHCVIHTNTGFGDTYCSIPEGVTTIHIRQINASSTAGYNTILNNQLKTGMKIFLDIEYFI